MRPLSRLDPHLVEEPLQYSDSRGGCTQSDMDPEVEDAPLRLERDPLTSGAEPAERVITRSGQPKAARPRSHPRKRAGTIGANGLTEIGQYSGRRQLSRDAWKTGPDVALRAPHPNVAHSESVRGIETVAERASRDEPRTRIFEDDPVPIEALERRTRGRGSSGRSCKTCEDADPDDGPPEPYRPPGAARFGNGHRTSIAGMSLRLQTG